MPFKQQTAWPTEADFEADLQIALRRAFPWLTASSIRHQTKFSFAFGRSQIHIDGRTASTAAARADILLYSGTQPLAVLELKRPGHPIDPSDIEQGLSYAPMLHPRPPLVAVTNGNDLKLIETHTGNEWTPSETSETGFAKLMDAASKVAMCDLKNSVSTLMGSNQAVWVQAVRQTSKLRIAELSGAWNEQLLPFVEDFLIPRKATAIAATLLEGGKRLILIEGPPLSGKSNLLRELVDRTEDSEDFAVLFIEAESGSGIFQGIASALAQALSWPVTRDEARAWLENLSKTSAPSLVIAVDSLRFERDDIRLELEDLTSYLFGSGIRVIVTVDDSLAYRLVMNSTGRKNSAIGRRATRVTLGLLDNEEFELAANILWDKRIIVMKGGQSSPDLRILWVLRAVVSQITSEAQYADENLMAALPPFLGMALLEHARERFTGDDELRRMVRAVAQAVLVDAEDRTRPIGLILKTMATYAVRRKTLLRHLEYPEIEKLVEQGYLRPMLHESGDAILIVRLPELLASEAAEAISIELSRRIDTNLKVAAQWLAETAAMIPLGDVIAAQALFDMALRNGKMPLSLITSFIDSPPERRAFPQGTKATMYFPGVGTMDMVFQGDGSIVVEARGQRHTINREPGDQSPLGYANIHGWLILSHFAARPMAIDEEGEPAARVDPMILLEVGTCPIVLRAVVQDPEMNGVVTHHIADTEFVCEKVGIVEPITLAILNSWQLAGRNRKIGSRRQSAANRCL